MNHRNLSQKIDDEQERLVDITLNCIFNFREDLKEEYNREQVNKSRRDLRYIFDYLSEALYFDNREIFINFALWLKRLFANIELGEAIVENTFTCIINTVQDLFAVEEAEYITEVLDEALTAIEKAPSRVKSYIQADNKNSAFARKYLDLILNNRKNEALNYILEDVSRKITIPELYLDVFQVVQREIGRLWHENKITVAQEHYSSSVTQLIISRLYTRFLSAGGEKGQIVTTAVGNELHEIGIRMVADLLEMDGYDTIHLGANTPLSAIIETIRLNKARLLAVSVTLPTHLQHLDELIMAIRSDNTIGDIKILVGGYAFNLNPDLQQKFDVDAYCPDAAAAVKRVNSLLGE